MPKTLQKSRSFRKTFLIRISYGILLFILTLGTIGIVTILKTKEFAFDTAFPKIGTAAQTTRIEVASFPIGVDPKKELITENPLVETYFDTHISQIPKKESKLSWVNHAVAKLAQLDWYQNLASPLSRILVIEPGERKEQVAKDFGDILHWSGEQRELFLTLTASSSPALREGKFFPGHYTVTTESTPEEVSKIIIDHFNEQVTLRYTNDIEKVVPLEEALTIASLLEREAYDFEDMRYISGVIWNRLFADMNLQIDASLQYAKANAGGNSWWPQVRPADKYIKSPFNTYKNAGLPPSPIANPSAEAILAALNPKSTDCIFYFHDADGGFHCTKTYEEHVALLKQYYGKGK